MTTGAFTSERVELFKLISSEMAMALDNAQVYQNLERSEKRFRATFEQAAVGIAHVSPDGRFLRINQKYCDIVGYSYEETLQLTFQDITYPDDLESDVAQVNQLLAGEIDTYSMDKRYISKNGELVWVNLTVSLVRNEAEQPQWFVAVVNDIAERKKAEKDNEKLLHDIGERLKELKCMYTISTSIRTKESLEEIFQDTVDAIPPGWHYPKITRAKLHYNDKEWVSEPFEETVWKQSSDIIIDGQKLGSVGVYYLEDCQVLDEGPFMKEERNLLNGIARTLTESIERMHATDKLNKSEEKYRDLVDNSIVGVFNSTLDGRFLFVNEAIVKMYDFDNAEQMLAKGSIVRWKDPKKREQLIIELQKYGDVTNFEAETITHTGRPIHVLFSVKLTSNNIIGMVMDITERKFAEESTLKYQRRLKDLAHELTVTEEVVRKQIAVDLHYHVGQLLASIRIQMSKISKIEENPEIIDRVENISQALRSAIQATRDAIFNLSPPQLNEIGLYPAVHDWMKEQIEFKHHIITSISGEDENLSIDENTRYLLFRSIRELLHNVVKHAQATKLDVNFCINNGSLEITVRDNGRGFHYNPDLLRLKSDSYGLFSIYERLSDMDGSLVVNSIIGKGSNVKLTIPIKDED